jgi:large subunit ribosomal protein L5
MSQQVAQSENVMRTIRIDKLTLNFGAGKDQKALEKGASLIKQLTGIEPVKTITVKRIPSWGLRPGLPVGAKITLRGPQAEELCRRLLTARDFKLKQTNIDQMGNVSFGLKEYIDIPGAKYDPAIGMIGLECSLTLKRAGYRVRDRKLRKGHISHRHRVSQNDATQFMKQKFSIILDEEQE